MSKFYAVKKGRNPGIYETWNECEQQVKGFSGAAFKSFALRSDAEDYMGISTGEKKDGNFSEEEIRELVNNASKITAFVDGSYDDEKKQYSYGLVALGMGKVYTDGCADFNPVSLPMRNVAGEILGAQFAMIYAMDNGIKELDIYYDYEGIENWATGAWKCKKSATQEYKRFFDSTKDKLNVNFHKVPAHTGIVFNEMADGLAKKALGI